MPRIPDEIRPDFERFVAGPALLRAAIQGLDAGAFNRRPPGDDWSIRAVVLHVTDAELVRSVSFRFVIAHDEAQIPGWDEERFKRRLSYLWRDPELALTLFQAARFSNAELLEQLDRAGWERSGVRGDGEMQTVPQLLARAAQHDETHVEQVLAMREALGVGAPAANAPGIAL